MVDRDIPACSAVATMSLECFASLVRSRRRNDSAASTPGVIRWSNWIADKSSAVKTSDSRKLHSCPFRLAGTQFIAEHRRAASQRHCRIARAGGFVPRHQRFATHPGHWSKNCGRPATVLAAHSDYRDDGRSLILCHCQEMGLANQAGRASVRLFQE